MKSKLRIPTHYKEGSADWEAEMDMLLPDGKTCADCANCYRCCTLFGSKPTDTSCQFYPSRTTVKDEQ